MQYKNLLIFVGGAAAGSLAAWFLTKKKYENISKSEIATMREVYKKKNEDLAKKARVKEPPEYYINENKKEEDLTAEEIRQIYDTQTVDEENSPEEENGEFIYIDDSEFISMNGYDKVNLVLYSDDILAKETDGDEIVLVEDTIGQEAVDNLREYMPEAIYVRNEATKTEYEVTRDSRTYGEVTGIYIKEYND